MIKSLRDARITDALPRVLAAQDWVRALSEALGVLQEKALDFTDGSQIYTAIDDVPETVLDALAVNWKIDWYDTGYSVDKKRRLVKTAMAVRRLMGTVAATRMQAEAVYPGTMLEEWFDYGGNPGCFRLYVDITHSTEQEPVTAFPQDEMERRLVTAKRWSAHLDSLSYMVRHELIIRHTVKGWAYTVPFCGTIRCGTWWMPSTLGWSEHRPLLVSARPEPFTVSPELSGTLPETRTAGWSVNDTLRIAGLAEGFADRLEYTGTVRSGTAAVVSTLGWSEQHSVRAEADANAHTAAPELSGTLPETVAVGWSVLCGTVRAEGAAAGYTGLPEPVGTGTSAGTLPKPTGAEEEQHDG